MKSNRIGVLGATAMAIVLAAASGAAATSSPPDVEPANLVYPLVTPNPLFPLVPGTTYYYEGEEEGVATTTITEVTCDTQQIEGVTATVVHDRAFAEGELVEDTLDYYAQDVGGTVWYFGEDTVEFPSLSTEGSWRAGVDDADAGFIMLASPQVQDHYYQEFSRNVAEDQARVVSLDGSACVPHQELCSDHLVVTKETSRLNPGVAENKYYAPGPGFVRGDVVKGGDEHTELVDVTTERCHP